MYSMGQPSMHVSKWSCSLERKQTRVEDMVYALLLDDELAYQGSGLDLRVPAFRSCCGTTVYPVAHTTHEHHNLCFCTTL